VIRNGFYAGLSILHGEIVSTGNWPAYIDAEDWQRIRRERSERARHRSRPVGRPPTALLARLARCECGAAMVIQRAGARKDGSRRRTYTCVTHMHRRDDCRVRPFDADEVERLVLGGLDRILRQSTAWADAVLAARRGERARIEAERDAAQADIRECNLAIKKLGEAYDRATLAGNADECELATMALAKRRESLAQATTRLDATLDALAASEDEAQAEDADAATARLWRALSGDIEAARKATGDRKALNSVLSEYFEAFTISRDGERLRIVPALTAEAAARGLRDALDGLPSNIEVHAYAVHDPDDPDAALALEISGPEALESSDQPDTQPRSRLLHNSHRGSWRGTAGGSPRRSRRDAPGRARRARW
jgi:Recombinase zinc beta ribbon domain